MQESLVIWCVLPLLSPPLHHSYLSFQWMALSSTLQRAPQSLPSFSECCYTRVWHPCFSTITGPLVRFWRVWVGDIFRLKVCIPLEVVPIDSCRLNDPIPPHKPCFFTLTGPLVRFWRFWVGDIFRLRVCIPPVAVPIDCCRLNDPIPPQKPPALSGYFPAS